MKYIVLENHPNDSRVKIEEDGTCQKFVFDARGNGGGRICPTITGDHQNRITDYTAIVLCLMQADGITTGLLKTSAAQ